MIDFHSHILPKMDDGSSSVDESIEMLELSFRKGVEKIVATPHFYAEKEPPERFLKRRRNAWDYLELSLPENTPKIYLGAEVYYYTGIAHTKELTQLCISGTNIILLEMPFHKWTSRMVDDIISISQNTDLNVLLAHIDRYLSFQPMDTWDVLTENGVLFQLNADALLDGWYLRRRALRLLRENKIAVLGSDCHNMRNRKPNLDEAFAIVRKNLGVEKTSDLTITAEQLLSEATIETSP